MDDEYVHNNPRDLMEERFVRLEEKVANISCNMSLLMAALVRNLGLFKEVGGLNSKIRSDGKSRDNKDPENESWKELEKEKSSSNTIKPSQYLFKMEEKVDIKPYQGEIDALKPNN
jgi:hypothetical protein